VLKLCDFGFARKISNNGEPLTDYVATRWYRSPELLLTDRYGKPADIWAIGCIMGELYDGKPLFPGKDQIDQLHLILKVPAAHQTMGPLTQDLKDYFTLNRNFKAANPEAGKNPIKVTNRYKGIVKDEALEFLKCLLEMSPKLRITAQEALLHPYFKKNRDKDPEFMGAEDTPSGFKIRNMSPEVDDQTSARNISQRMTLNGTTSLNRNLKNIRVSSLQESSLDKKLGTLSKIGKLPGMSSEEHITGSLNKPIMPKTYYNVYESQDADKKKIKNNWSTKNYGNKDYQELTNKIFYNENAGATAGTGTPSFLG